MRLGPRIVINITILLCNFKGILSFLQSVINFKSTYSKIQNGESFDIKNDIYEFLCQSAAIYIDFMILESMY